MIKEALQYVAGLAARNEKTEVLEICGRTYANKDLVRYDMADKATPLEASSLTALVDRLVRERVPLNVCLTSNLTLLYQRPEDHPLRQLLDAGAAVTLNRDDPSFLGGLTLTEELRRAAEFASMTRAELLACQEAAVEAAFCSPETKAALRRALAEFSRT